MTEGAEAFREQFEKAMDDDLNTADALAAVYDLVRYINSNVADDTSAETVEKLKDLFDELTGILGLDLSARAAAEGDITDEEIEALIAKRQEAKKAKDYAGADAVRDELKAKGVVLEDTREGVKWKRV